MINIYTTRFLKSRFTEKAPQLSPNIHRHVHEQHASLHTCLYTKSPFSLSNAPHTERVGTNSSQKRNTGKWRLFYCIKHVDSCLALNNNVYSKREMGQIWRCMTRAQVRKGSRITSCASFFPFALDSIHPNEELANKMDVPLCLNQLNYCQETSLFAKSWIIQAIISYNIRF